MFSTQKMMVLFHLVLWHLLVKAVILIDLSCHKFVLADLKQ